MPVQVTSPAADPFAFFVLSTTYSPLSLSCERSVDLDLCVSFLICGFEAVVGYAEEHPTNPKQHDGVWNQFTDGRTADGNAVECSALTTARETRLPIPCIYPAKYGTPAMSGSDGSSIVHN